MLNPPCIFNFCSISSSLIYNYLVKLPNKGGLDVVLYDKALFKSAVPIICEMLTLLFHLSTYICIFRKDWK